MGQFFNFKLLDIWNDPAMKILRGGIKVGGKTIASTHTKKNYEQSTTTEQEKLLKAAQAGDSTAQYNLALDYLGEGDLKQYNYWLKRSAQQGNVSALELLGALQGD